MIIHDNKNRTKRLFADMCKSHIYRIIYIYKLYTHEITLALLTNVRVILKPVLNCLYSNKQGEVNNNNNNNNNINNNNRNNNTI